MIFIEWSFKNGNTLFWLQSSVLIVFNKLCTTSFLVEVSQFIKFGDLTANEESRPVLLDLEAFGTSVSSLSIPQDEIDGVYTDVEPLTDKEVDALLRVSLFCSRTPYIVLTPSRIQQAVFRTGSPLLFAGWFSYWKISRMRDLKARQVVQPKASPYDVPDHGYWWVSTVQVVDAVIGACSQICVHLSEPLYDLVLNMIFDYASTNVRPNTVRAIHQLVECVANANPNKTLAKFLPFCSKNIQVELENGASSVRTTSVSTPLPSDATLHWSKMTLMHSLHVFSLSF